MSQTARLTVVPALVLSLSLFACMSNPHLVGGKNYVKQEVWEKAVVELKIATEQQPGNAEAWYYLGWAYGEAGDYGNAGDAFRKSKEISDAFTRDVDEKSTFFWEDLAARGQDLERGGNYDAAAEKFEAALKLRPDHLDSYNYVAGLYVKMGDVEGAAEKYEAALEMDPDNEAALTNYAKFLEESSLEARAIPLFERLAEKRPDDENLSHHLASLYIKVGDRDKGVEMYRKLGDPSFFLSGAYEAFSKEDFKGALDNYMLAAEIADPASVEYRDAKYNAVVAAYKMDDFETAASLGEKLVKEIPEEARNWRILGNSYARLKKNEKSLEAHKRAEDLERRR